jgi:hypothetical protein
VKFETTPGFDNDYRRLEREHADTFKRVVREKFAPADARATFALIAVDGGSDAGGADWAITMSSRTHSG